MPAFTSYRPGTPSWVDLATPDTTKASEFYGVLFGWDTVDMGPEAGGYVMFQKQGKNVAGATPITGDGQHPAWTSYVSVVDAEATVARIKVAGGTVFLEPMDVLSAGRMALFTDVTGAVLGLWQPANHIGADLANEPGTWCWNELSTRDTARAATFYQHVFGWEAVKTPAADIDYSEWKLDGATIGGMMPMPPAVPDAVPAHWLVYFAVDDTDATLATATTNGGSVLVPPTDITPGRFCVLADPAGATFAVIAMRPAL